MNETHPSHAISNALFRAARTARELEDSGSPPVGAFTNGRRMVLLTNKAPAGVRGGIKSRCRPRSGFRVLMMAAELDGCQIEWNETVPAPLEVRHG